MRLFLAAPLVMGYILVSFAAPVVQRQTLSHLGERRVNPKRTGFSDVVTIASFPSDSSTRLIKRVPADSKSGAPKTPPSRVSLSSRKVQAEIAKAKQKVVEDANTQLRDLHEKALEHRASLGGDASEEAIQHLRSQYGDQASLIANTARDHSYPMAIARVTTKYEPHIGRDPGGYQKWLGEHEKVLKNAREDWPGLKRDTNVFGDGPFVVDTEFTGARPSGTGGDVNEPKIQDQPPKAISPGQSSPSDKNVRPGTETGPRIEGGPVDLESAKLPKRL